jgi:hypothetical protein
MLVQNPGNRDGLFPLLFARPGNGGTEPRLNYLRPGIADRVDIFRGRSNRKELYDYARP